ncbi:MAG: sigma-54 dependent transcriptional regulator [Gemmatimonadota bacterium]|nr:sigma-54 dependent transcriptional regulator [Gemmatimonadota bacterium]
MTYQLASHEAPVTDRSARGGTSDFAFQNVIGSSPALRDAVEFARRVATRNLTTVLLSGETGTGKELFARGIHYASPSPGEPFVAVNCPAIPATLLESELFGHERGAFTDARSLKQGLFELAGGGTLFLDEISDLPADLQPKLLRALEERRVRRLGGFREIEVRCRVVAATNRSLERAVADGKFREDLFNRLNPSRLELPPLRDRPEDIPTLARHFSKLVAEEQGMPEKDLWPRTLEVLQAHDWPGNVRELKNVIQRATLVGMTPWIRVDDLDITRSRAALEPLATDDGQRTITIPALGKSLDVILGEAVRHTLEITGGNRSAAARILGISRPTLLRKIRTFGLETVH